MDKLIGWLFQRTLDGSTYLQVIIIGFLLWVLLYVFLNDLLKFIEELYKGDKNDEI